MQITMKTQDLVRELTMLEKITAKKATMPILSNVLIKAHDRVELSTTDLEIAMTGSCAANIGTQGAVTVPVKKLLDLARAQSSATITLSAQQNALQIVAGQFRSKLQASMFIDDFPILPDPVTDGAVPLPRTATKSMLNQVRHAISDKDQQQYMLKGALLVSKDNKLSFVATDPGHLAVSSISRQTDGQEVKILIPVKTVDQLISLLSEGGDAPVLLSSDTNHLFFRIDHRVMISNRLDGEFPAYERVIPADDTIKIRVAINRNQLISVIRRCALISDVVRLALSDKSLEVTSASAEGESAEQIGIGYSGDPVSLLFKGQYLLDFLSEATSDMVVLALKDELSPVMLIDGGYLNIIMPMRNQ